MLESDRRRGLEISGLQLQYVLLTYVHPEPLCISMYWGCHWQYFLVVQSTEGTCMHSLLHAGARTPVLSDMTAAHLGPSRCCMNNHVCSDYCKPVDQQTSTMRERECITFIQPPGLKEGRKE